MTKTFKKNKDGKIEFTEANLKKLLDEVYNSGYYDGKSCQMIWNSPYHYEPTYYYGTSITSTGSDVTWSTTNTSNNATATLVTSNTK